MPPARQIAARAPARGHREHVSDVAPPGRPCVTGMERGNGPANETQCSALAPVFSGISDEWWLVFCHCEPFP